MKIPMKPLLGAATGCVLLVGGVILAQTDPTVASNLWLVFKTDYSQALSNPAAYLRCFVEGLMIGGGTALAVFSVLQRPQR